jgi:hypothetical protein
VTSLSPRRAAAPLALLLALGLGVAADAAPPDRLDRFRALATGRGVAVRDGVDIVREMYALMDEEIVESLASGGFFASPFFLQDRMDGFAEAWGAAHARIERVGPLVVGAFALGDAPGGASVRVYGSRRGHPALLATLARDGLPAVHPVAAPPGQPALFVVAWEGAPSGRGTHLLRLDLVRQRGDDVELAWSTADVYDGALIARSYAVRGTELRVRYELRYPGWAPGCAGQTEVEDVFRVEPPTGQVVAAGRRDVNGWHRDVHAAAARLFAALAADEPATLAALVPDARVRHRLPPRLEAEPACDDAGGAAEPAVVTTAARAATEPWTLTWVRADRRWRLEAADPVSP